MGLTRRLLCVVTGHDFFSLGYYDDIEFHAVFEGLKCRHCGKVVEEFRTWGSTDDPDLMKTLRYVDRGEDP